MDGDSATPLDWSGMLAPGHAHLVLNLDGSGVVLGSLIRLSLFPGMIGICRNGAGENVHASRLPGSGRHRFLVVSLSAGWLAGRFSGVSESLHPMLRAGWEPDRTTAAPVGQTRTMSLAERDLCESLMSPPVPRALRPMWFRGKLLECVSLFGAAPVEPGSEAHPKQNEIRRRIDEATLWLRENLAEELDLTALSRHVGCAPHYLSRLYRLHTGMTLSRKLRQMRVDHAAALLRNGGCNVTEAALEVGYSSLSHFTKAFFTEKGVRPSDYRNG